MFSVLDVNGNRKSVGPAHTHAESEIVGLVADLAAKEAVANKNLANGYAGLDAGGNLAVSLLSNGTFTYLDSTATGATNDWAPGLDGNTFVTWHGASDLALTGIAGGVAGQLFILRNVSGGPFVSLAHNSGSSAAAARLRNCATVGLTYVAVGGWAIYQHDGTAWRMVGHTQGASLTPAYASGDFGAASGTWTVDAGDVVTYSFILNGRQLTVSFYISTSSISGATAALKLKIPGGYTPVKDLFTPLTYYDGAAWHTDGAAEPAGTDIFLYTAALAGWVAATNTIRVVGSVTLEVN